MVTVDAAVFCFIEGRAHILLIRRAGEPFKGLWALPGGFVEMDEELKDAAARELEEETGITNIDLRQMQTFGRCGRDPRGRNISVVFMGIAQETGRPKAGDDAASAGWFDIRKLPGGLAFDHSEVIKSAITRLEQKKSFGNQ